MMVHYFTFQSKAIASSPDAQLHLAWPDAPGGDDCRHTVALCGAIGQDDIAELLLANKADVNAKEKGDGTPLGCGGTPLHRAAEFGHRGVELLLAHKWFKENHPDR